jgi:hypothetical protein
LVNTQPSLVSRVCAGWPSALPLRPSVSLFTTGRPVPSICTYRIGSPTMMGRSSRTILRISFSSLWAMSAPMAPLCVLPTWSSLPNRRERSSVHGGDRSEPPGPSHLACGALRATNRGLRCRVGDRRGIGRYDSADTDTRGAPVYLAQSSEQPS